VPSQNKHHHEIKVEKDLSPAAGKWSIGVISKANPPKQKKHRHFIQQAYTYLYRKAFSCGHIPEYAQFKVIGQEGKMLVMDCI
jgi:hypothetical protein